MRRTLVVASMIGAALAAAGTPGQAEAEDTCDCGTRDRPTQLRFTSVPPTGGCGMLLGATGSTLLGLRCGSLYRGGGGSRDPGAPISDTSRLVVNANCRGTTLTLAGAMPAQVAGPRPQEHCSSAGCRFGAPLPIPNPSSRPASACVINVVRQDAAGTSRCDAGAMSLILPLVANVYLTGDLDAEPANGIQPCPVCSTNDALDPSTACPPGGQPCCQFGPRSGATCTPATAANVPAPYATSHDCPPPSNLFLGGLSIELALTSGSVRLTSEALGTEPGRSRVFCGFCRDVDRGSDAFGTCQDGPLAGEVCRQRTDCQGGTCSGARRCTTNADCSQPLETCAQRNDGAFGRADATTIVATGTPFGDLRDRKPHPGVLASLFCMPPVLDASADAVLDLPGPGAAALRGEVQLLPE